MAVSHSLRLCAVCEQASSQASPGHRPDHIRLQRIVEPTIISSVLGTENSSDAPASSGHRGSRRFIAKQPTALIRVRQFDRSEVSARGVEQKSSPPSRISDSGRFTDQRQCLLNEAGRPGFRRPT